MQDQNLKQMQEHIDFMVTKFQETIKKFDDLKGMVSKLYVLTNDLSLKVSTNQSEHEKVVQSVKSIAENSYSAHSLSKDRVDANVSAIVSLKNDIDEEKKLSTEIVLNHVKLNNRIAYLETKAHTYLNPDHLAPLTRRMNECEDFIELNAKSVLKGFKDTSQAHVNLKDQLTQVSADLETYSKCAKTTHDLAGSAHEKCEKISQNVRDSIASMGRLCEDAIDKKIKAIPVPSIPDYSAQIKAIESQHEPIRFDAANAKLRSENTEKKMFLLEKKVEQLQLMLDKLKLGG